jgi:phosphopantetheinyl transferase
VGDIVDMAEFRKKKAERQLSQRQFHPAFMSLFDKISPEIDARLREMGLSPEDYKD